MDIVASPLVASLPVLPAPVAPTAVPDASATARFAALMQSPAAAGTPAMDHSASAAATAMHPAIDSPTSVGDRILAGMQGVSSDFQSAWKSVAATLDASADTMGMQDMLKLQMQLVQVSVQYDLVGKAVSRSTQNFDQLVRVQ